jgi:hypothetical protein
LAEDSKAGPGPIADDQAFLDRISATALTHTSETKPHEPEPQLQPVKWWSVESAMTMSAIVLLFGLVTILIGAFLALRQLSQQTILKVVVIPMVVMAAVFLVVAGYSDQQMAPAMGLLGTVVGYVLGTGREARKISSSQSKADPKAASATVPQES